MLYDLEKRTTLFSIDIISLVKILPKNIITIPLISQLVRSATSIGANYREANGGVTRKDFKNKIHYCKKEANETMYWLELLLKADESYTDKCKKLWKEARELTLIFSKIASSSK